MAISKFPKYRTCFRFREDIFNLLKTEKHIDQLQRQQEKWGWVSRKFKKSLNPRHVFYFAHKFFSVTRNKFKIKRIRGKSIKNSKIKRGILKQSLRYYYRTNLFTKQKLKITTDLFDFQLKNYWKQSQTIKGNSQQKFFNFLESRIDKSLVRSGLAKSLSQSKQFLFHGKVFLNSKIVTKRNYQLNTGDLICINTNENAFNTYIEKKKFRFPPRKIWINKNYFFTFCYTLFAQTYQKNYITVSRESMIEKKFLKEKISFPWQAFISCFELDPKTFSFIFLNRSEYSRNFPTWTNISSILNYYKTN